MENILDVVNSSVRGIHSRGGKVQGIVIPKDLAFELGFKGVEGALLGLHNGIEVFDGPWVEIRYQVAGKSQCMHL